jgi:hypothetical protein
MKPLRTSGIEAQPVGCLLLVRCAGDLPSALRSANQLLVRRVGSPGDAVLGILVGSDPEQAIDDLAETSERSAVTLRDSVGVSSIWSLCRFESHLLMGAQPGIRRRWILESVLARVPGRGSQRHAFILVLAATERFEDVDALVETLRKHHLTLAIDRNVFASEPLTGEIVRLKGAERSLVGFS